MSVQPQQIAKDDLVLVEEVPKHVEIECPVCLNVLADPHLVTCCGHNFCGPCIERVKAGNGSCPLCKEMNYQAVADKKCSRIINGLQVYCTNQKSGCQWAGELKNLSAHLSQGNREGDCQCEGVKCRHEGCVETCLRSYIAQHESNECMYRPYKCEHCMLEGTKISISKHYGTCPLYPVCCPNECMSIKMPQCNLKDHLKKCTLEPVDCALSWAGCKERPLRKDIELHTTDSKHMMLLAVACGELKKENEKLKEENETIKGQMKDVDDVKTENQKLLKVNKMLQETCDQLKDHIHRVMDAESYPIMPVTITSDEDVVHFYTGVCGRHMSAKVILMKRSTGRSWSTTFKVFLVFHEGKYDNFRYKIPKISLHYKGKPFPLLEDTDAFYPRLPDDTLEDLTKHSLHLPLGVMHKLVNLDGMFTRCSFKITD